MSGRAIRRLDVRDNRCTMHTATVFDAAPNNVYFGVTPRSGRPSFPDRPSVNALTRIESECDARDPRSGKFDEEKQDDQRG